MCGSTEASSQAKGALGGEASAYYRVANMVNEGFDPIQISQPLLARAKTGINSRSTTTLRRPQPLLARAKTGGLSMLPGGSFCTDQPRGLAQRGNGTRPTEVAIAITRGKL